MDRKAINIFKIEDVEDGVCEEYFEKVGINVSFIYKNMQATMYFNNDKFTTGKPSFEEIKDRIIEVINS